MNQKVVAITVAVAAGVAAYFASGILFGGTRLQATSKPKLSQGWTPWESWKKHAFVAMPPNYVEYATSNMPIAAWARRMEEDNPKMLDLLTNEVATPDHVVLGVHYDTSGSTPFLDHFVVKYRPGWPKMSLSDFIASVQKDPAKSFPGAKSATAEEVKHPNGKVVKVEYGKSMEGSDGKPIDLQAVAYVFINGDNGHLMEFRTTKDKVAKMKPLIEKTAEDFRVTFN